MQNNSQGFTLLEAVFAIAIFAIAFTEILNLQSRSILDVIQARQYNTVAQLARNKMVETEIQIRGKAFTEVTKEQGGTFEAPNQDFSWALKIEEIEIPQINTNSGQPETDISRQLTQGISKFLAKSLRQITVSIVWKKNNKDQTYSVSTYWVDLSNEFSL